MKMGSEQSKFYRLSLKERLSVLARKRGLNEEEIRMLESRGCLQELAERMIENVIGVMEVPLGLAVNFLINGNEYLIPMAIEEPSVVAAASNAARIARLHGGFVTNMISSCMIGQIQLVGVDDPLKAKARILECKDKILERANECDPILVKFGGGARDIEVRVIDTRLGPMVITHLIVDTRDAMGANAVNTMVEAVAPMIEEMTGGHVYLRILSNLATKRLVKAQAVFDKEALGGESVVDGILSAWAFAESDPYRAATHNKGIMNGITALVLATGNDTRAVEAGAHAYAAIKGRYSTLTAYEKDKEGNLVGTIELPCAVGLVGGATKTHPKARLNLKILGVESASELAQVAAALGLAQNLAALRALTCEGIQKGHMSLHARNIAIMAGAQGDLIDAVAERMVAEKCVRMDRAQEILKELGGQ
jgi:hydroxymethylglutaryl-CoA reductase